MKTYLQSCMTDFWQRVLHAEAQYLLRYLAAATDVLSVGCGPAVVEGLLSARGFRVTGLDVSPDALACAPDTVRTVAGRAEDMPFPESSFDAVVYVVSLQFIEDFAKALQETTRVLRPGGTLLILLLNPESDFFREKMRDPDSYVRRIRHTDLKAIEDVVARGYNVRTEYCLGVKGDAVFESRDRNEACLYAITAALKDTQEKKP